MSLAPPVPDTRTPAWLVAQINTAKVFDEAQLRPYLSEFRAVHPHGDATGLAAFLVQAGILTEFQAERLLVGDAGNLALGPYLLTTPVGSGSLGTVYQAVGRKDRKRYAVKLLPLRSLWNVHLAKRTVQALAALPPHPAIVPLVDVDTAGGSHYLVWPFAEGTTLADRVTASGRLPTGEAVPVLTAIADALTVCHANGIVHGLLKPSNLIVGPDGQVRLLDVGMGAILAENLADDESMLDTISTANSALGMVDCAAPETLADPTTRTPAADLYSFGCVLYFLLTGRTPFPDGNFIDKVIAHQTQTPTPPRAVHPGIPEWLDELALLLLGKTPAARAASMAEVRDRLQKGGTGRPVVPVPVRPAARKVEAAPFEDRRAMPEFRLSNPDSKLSRPDTTAVATDPASDTGAASDVISQAVAGLPAPSSKISIRLPELTDTPTGRGAPTLPPRPSELPPPVLPPAPPRRGLFSRLGAALAFWKPAADTVQVTVFGPRAVAPGDNLRLQVYTHQPDAFESVQTLARALTADADLIATDYLGRDVTRGATVGLHLSVAGAGVARSLVLFNWLGQPHPRSFEVHVPWESMAGPMSARLSAGVNGVLAGTVAFHLMVQPRRG